MRKKDFLAAIQAFVVSAVVVLGGAVLAKIYLLESPILTLTINK